MAPRRAHLLHAISAVACTLAAAQIPSAPFSIVQFGAVAGVDTQQQAVLNGAALNAALNAAATATNASQRGVLIPHGLVFAYLPPVQTFSQLTDVTLLWEGTLALYTNNFTSFPGWPNVWPGMAFFNCSRLSIISTTGDGLFNGRGNLWWWYTILVADHRNNLLNIVSSSDVFVEGITLLNSPQYHAFFIDVLRAVVNRVTVRVDIMDQVNVLRYLGGAPLDADIPEVLRLGGMAGPLLKDGEGMLADPETVAIGRSAVLSAAPAEVLQAPWFDASWHVTPPIPMVWALNTDGIDISGLHINVTNCNVTNFDDSVCVKPLGSRDNSAFGTTCSSDIEISDIIVTWGVGISMGSVPPDVGGNCINGVYAHRIHSIYPLKGAYIKPNPAKSDPTATGTIANIVYEDFQMDQPVWWAIYVGTQQQAQPGSGSNTGCSFLYPLPGQSCPTDPQVTVANVTFRNVTINEPLLSPGILIANASNPATGFVFDGVVVTGNASWPVSDGNYLCEFVQGVATGGTTPVPHCFTTA